MDHAPLTGLLCSVWGSTCRVRLWGLNQSFASIFSLFTVPLPFHSVRILNFRTLLINDWGTKVVVYDDFYGGLFGKLVLAHSLPRMPLCTEAWPRGVLYRRILILIWYEAPVDFLLWVCGWPAVQTCYRWKLGSGEGQDVFWSITGLRESRIALPG